MVVAGDSEAEEVIMVVMLLSVPLTHLPEQDYRSVSFGGH